jgi:hypothetical protein
MDQSDAPLLDALIDYHAEQRYGFTPSGHRQRGGVDDRVPEGRQIGRWRRFVWWHSGFGALSRR